MCEFFGETQPGASGIDLHRAIKLVKVSIDDRTQGTFKTRAIARVVNMPQFLKCSSHHRLDRVWICHVGYSE